MPAMPPENVTHFESPEAFRGWMDAHHTQEEALWVGYWKKATKRPSMTWEESVDVALCYGWIDGIRQRVDDEAYTIRFTPRRPGSTWSHRNMERYAVLLEQGLIADAGSAAYGRRTEGRSGIYSFEQQRAPELSQEYEDRLRAEAAAWADWEARPPSYKRVASHWVMSAKRESTRERRLAALIEGCSAGRKVKPLR